jgi:hypothetical protein
MIFAVFSLNLIFSSVNDISLSLFKGINGRFALFFQNLIPTVFGFWLVQLSALSKIM